jgi:hypothetical protein
MRSRTVRVIQIWEGVRALPAHVLTKSARIWFLYVAKLYQRDCLPPLLDFDAVSPIFILAKLLSAYGNRHSDFEYMP